MKKILLSLTLCFSLFSLSAQNQGIRLDGTTESLSVAHKDNQNVGDAFTIEAWIFANNWTNEIWRGSIVNKDNQGPDRGYGFRCGENGKLSFVMAVDNTWEETFSGAAMNVNQWHHVAVTVGDQTVRLYIDGQEVASNSFTGQPSDLPQEMTLGASTGFDGRFFDGVLDEIRIWNTTRTAQELADNSTVDLTGSENGLAYYFPMNDGMGNIATNIVDPSCSATGNNIDDSNWVDGYQLPEFDLSINNIGNIDRYNMKTRPVKISVNVQNVGLSSLENPDMTVSVNGDAIFTEMADISLEAGEASDYIFKTPLDLTQDTDIEITVELNHPDDSNALNNTTQTELVNQSGDRVSIFKSEPQNGASQNKFSNLLLPGDLSIYERLLLHISLDCPSGGCDPWDQTAKVIASSSRGTYEIARYITPYGISCGNWIVDVTDFKSILTGANVMNSFVQVWGPSGWLVNIDLEMIEGSGAMPYSRVNNLWSMDYQVYGDPGISHDLPAISHSIDNNTESSHVRMQITGHGQGNTNNAAEFYNVNHDFVVDGNVVETHNLWKSDCNQNPCSNQAGTWLTPRAGWCPGQEVQPKFFDMDGVASGGATVEVDYVFQDYTNLLNTGYNSSGHTEPHYRVHGFYVEESSQRYEDYTNLQATAIDYDVNQMGVNNVMISLTNDGNLPVMSYQVQYFINYELIATQDIQESIAPGESRTINFTEVTELTQNVNTIFAEVIAINDQNPGDNLVLEIEDSIINTKNIMFSETVTISPNPSTGIFTIEKTGALDQSVAEVFSIDGKRIKKLNLSSNTTDVNLDTYGIHIVKITNINGDYTVRKVIIAR